VTWWTCLAAPADVAPNERQLSVAADIATEI